jgi:hypothetical protein
MRTTFPAALAATCFAIVLTACGGGNSNSATDAQLAVTVVGPTGTTSTGRVASQPAGIDCGSTCNAAFVIDTVVTLTAAAPAGQQFSAWGGACSGAAATCTVTMSESRSVTATFMPASGGHRQRHGVVAPRGHRLRQHLHRRLCRERKRAVDCDAGKRSRAGGLGRRLHRRRYHLHRGHEPGTRHQRQLRGSATGSAHLDPDQQRRRQRALATRGHRLRQHVQRRVRRRCERRVDRCGGQRAAVCGLVGRLQRPAPWS